MTLKELIFNPGNTVYLEHIDDGDAVYKLVGPIDAGYDECLMIFKVPKEDLRGGIFRLYDSPKLFMRWIRKQLEVQEEQKKLIDQAKKDWEEGKQY